MRKADIPNLKSTSIKQIDAVVKRLKEVQEQQYMLSRWVAQMSVVEIHSVWERYAEKRLAATLNRDATYFIAEQEIKGVQHVSLGLASFVVRGGARFFDFRSAGELITKSDRLLGNSQNPFRRLTMPQRDYIDCMAAIRNCVVHGSEHSQARYRQHLKAIYGISSAPAPDEFLNAVDNRGASPARYQKRIVGIATVVNAAISIA